jgi:hypothetical protein
VHYPVERINLRQWFTERQIKDIMSQQCEQAKVLAEHGWQEVAIPFNIVLAEKGMISL